VARGLTDGVSVRSSASIGLETARGSGARGRACARVRACATSLVVAALAFGVSLAVPAVALAAAVRTPANYNANAILRGDDTYSSVVALPLAMNWNGTTYTNIYINMNGNCTFGDFSTLYNPATPMATTNRDMLAPFWADVDTRVGGGSAQMTYSAITSGSVPQVDGRNAFIVNWIGVGRYATSGPLNSFQLVLIDRSDTGAGNFDIEYNYDTILWDRGTAASTNYARAGWSRIGNVGYEITGGNSNGAYLDTGANALVAGSLNSGGVPGRYVWSVRNGVPPNSPPVITLAFTSRDLEANGPTGLSGYTGAGDATAVDNDGSIASFVRTPAAGTFLPLGSTTVTWTATDNLGAVTTATQTVVVADRTPPALPALLWSSSHILSSWSGLPPVTANWTDSVDLANGVAGYSFDFTQDAAGLPDTTTDTFTTVGAGGATLESQTFPNNTWPTDWARPAGDSQTYLRANNAAGRNHGTSAAELWANNTTRRNVQFSKTFDLSGHPVATLSFWDHSTQTEAGDYNRVEYSTDGATWIPLQNFVAPAAWAPRSYLLPAGQGYTDVTVRFSGSVNANNEYVCWDDIVITGSTPAHNTTTQALGDGSWYFNVRAVDGIGRWTATAASLGPFWIDTEPPATGSSIASDWVDVAPTVALIGVDALSGTAGTMYRVDGGGWTAYAGPFVYATDGAHVFDFYSTDTVGNRETTRSATLRLDRADPTTPTGLSATASGGSALLSWNAATDALSGMREYRIYRGGSLVGTSTTTGFSGDVPSEGTYSYTVAAVDNAGNIGAQGAPFVLFVDTTPPTLPVLTSPTHPLTDHWYGPGAVALNWTDAIDLSSGIAGYSYSWTASVGGLPDTVMDAYTPGVPIDSTLEDQSFPTLGSWPADWARPAGDSQTYLRVNTVRSNSAPCSAELWANNTTRRTVQFSKTFDLSARTAATLSFWDYSVQIEGPNDLSAVDYSTDGTTWTPLQSRTTNVGWTLRTFALPTGAGANTVTVRFRGSVNANNEYVCWDDILLTVTSPGPNRTVVDPGEGRWHFNVRAVDGAWNWTPGAADLGQIWIDTTPPTTGSDIPAYWVNVSPTVSLVGLDPLSGVAGTRYRVDGGGWADYSGPFLYSTDGTHVFDFYSTDAVGNVEATKGATLRLDRADPTTPTGVAATPVDTATIDVVWDASTDALSGLSHYSVYQDGSLVATTSATTWDATGLVAGQTVTFYIVAVDAAGNQSPASITATATTPLAMLRLDISEPSVDFASLVPGTPSTISDAAIVSVSGMGAIGYELSCAAADFSGPGATTMPIGALHFATRGYLTLADTAFTNAKLVIGTSTGGPALWAHDYIFDLTMSVPWTSDPEAYATTIVYTVVSN
jgi:hypothetical protein